MIETNKDILDKMEIYIKIILLKNGDLRERYLHKQRL